MILLGMYIVYLYGTIINVILLEMYIVYLYGTIINDNFA